MSEAKRAALIAAGVIGPDGERVNTCPTCGKPGYEPENPAQPEAVRVSAKTTKAG